MPGPERRVSFAQGYFALGLHRHAAAELALVPAPLGLTREVLLLHAAALQALRRWPRLLLVAEALATRYPEDASGWIMWAYAARRTQSLAAAERILLRGEERHPREATIQFNLGCYACVRGDLAAARERVNRAIALDQTFAQAARTDRDLRALRKAEKPARPRPRKRRD